MTVGALEALPVPRASCVHHPGLCYRPQTLAALLTVLLFVARYTYDFLAARYKAGRADLFLADLAAEALGVPLATSMLVFLHAGSEDRSTERASRREIVLVARGAVEPLVLVGERGLGERDSTRRTAETFVVPVSILVGEIAIVACYLQLTLVAGVSEQILVAALAERAVVVKNVPLTDQAEGTVSAGELAALPVVRQRACKVICVEHAVWSNAGRPPSLSSICPRILGFFVGQGICSGRATIRVNLVGCRVV